MNKYKLRISFTPNNNLHFDDIKDILNERVERYIMGFEVGKKHETPHTHAYIEMSCDRETIKNDIRKKVKPALMKRPEWSFTTVKDWKDDPTGIKPKCYAMKDGDYITKGFTPEELLEIQQAESLTKASIAEAKKERKPVWKKIIDTITPEEKKSYLTDDATLSVMSVSRKVSEYYREGDSQVSLHQLEGNCRTICLKLIPKYLDMISNQLYDRLVPYDETTRAKAQKLMEYQKQWK